VFPNKFQIQAIVAGYHENKMLQYDVLKRQVKTKGIKEYDLAHNAIILDDSKFKALIFESHIGKPLAKLYIDSKFQNDVYLKDVANTKFSRLYNFEGRQGLVVGVCGPTLTCLSTKDGLSLLKYSTIRNFHDTGNIQHVEILQGSYLIICTQKAFYRLAL